MSQRPFVCVDCGYRVSAASFRAACPDCGGTLSEQSLEDVRADGRYHEP